MRPRRLCRALGALASCQLQAPVASAAAALARRPRPREHAGAALFSMGAQRACAALRRCAAALPYVRALIQPRPAALTVHGVVAEGAARVPSDLRSAWQPQLRGARRAPRSREFDLGWKLYGDQSGEPVYFGDKAEGKFGCYFVKDGKVRARLPYPYPYPKPVCCGGQAESKFGCYFAKDGKVRARACSLL